MKHEEVRSSHKINYPNFEGITRQFSPLSFSSSTPTTKTITSGLTQTINATIVTNSECDGLYSISYTDSSGTTTDMTDSISDCSNDQIIFQQLSVGSGNNLLSFVYSNYDQCIESRSAVVTGIGVVFLLITILVIGAVITILFVTGKIEFTMYGLLAGVVSIGAVIILMIVMIYFFGSTCEALA